MRERYPVERAAPFAPMTLPRLTALLADGAGPELLAPANPIPWGFLVLPRGCFLPPPYLRLPDCFQWGGGMLRMVTLPGWVLPAPWGSAKGPKKCKLP